MSVIYGPDGKPITTGKPTPDPRRVNVMEISKTDMATDASRARTVKHVMDFQMDKARTFVMMMESMGRGNKCLTLGPSDEYHQCPLLEDGVDTGHKVTAEIARQYREKDWKEGYHDEV